MIHNGKRAEFQPVTGASIVSDDGVRDNTEVIFQCSEQFKVLWPFFGGYGDWFHQFVRMFSGLIHVHADFLRRTRLAIFRWFVSQFQPDSEPALAAVLTQEHPVLVLGWYRDFKFIANPLWTFVQPPMPDVEVVIACPMAFFPIIPSDAKDVRTRCFDVWNRSLDNPLNRICIEL